jgi:hypothetical protein
MQPPVTRRRPAILVSSSMMKPKNGARWSGSPAPRLVDPANKLVLLRADALLRADELTGDQLASLLASQGSGSNQSPSAAQPSPTGGTNPPESVTQNSASSTPPTITINGANPAIITIGDTYADLGATVSDTGQRQAGDPNLGLKYFLNGALVSNIGLDTSAVATDTIDYVATDTLGNTATSTRTVIVEAQASSPPAVSSATTSAATSTTQ